MGSDGWDGEKKRDALETESWRLREERRKFGERTDRFLGRYDVDSKSSAILGPTASNLKAQKTVCRGWAGQVQAVLEPIDEPTLPS